MIAVTKRIIVLLKNATGTYYLKPDRDFGGILSNVSPCRPSLSGIVNSDADVKCEEICVCCHRVSRRVSDYIRHAERHRDVGQLKATYINQMCDELRGRAANELGLAESGGISRVERRSKKRAREGGYIDSRTSGAQKARLHVVDMTIMNELGFQLANSINPLQIPSLNLYQTRYTSSSPLHAVGHSTYASLKCCRARSYRRLSKHVNRGILPRVYRRTNRSSGRHQLRCSYKWYHKLS